MIVDLKTPVHPLIFENRGGEDRQFAGVSVPPGEFRQFRGLSKLEYAATATLQGMLAHKRRYHPRAEDEHLHWHEAIAREACDLAEALISEAVRRETTNQEAGGDE